MSTTSPITQLNKDCLSVIFSFLDVTEYEDKNIAATLLNALDIREKTVIKQIKKYWNINSKYTIITDRDGMQAYYKNYKLHRDGGPAVILANGTQKWYVNDQLHRDDGPAVNNSDGEQHWYRNGKLHRDNDLPAAILADGTQIWYAASS